MSHRVVTTTNITDKKIATMALNKKGWAFVDEGTSLRITSGPMDRATINLKTGEVVGDSDFHGYSRGTGNSSLEALNQEYAVQKIRATVRKQGGTIQSQKTVGEQVILMAHMA